ncbi:MAG: NUDIX domain-containing protein [Bacillota bacterium]
MKYPEPVVGAVIFNPENEILLCKSNKFDKYVIPGGHIEVGEKMEQALRREILEETGLKIYDIELISLKEGVFEKGFSEKKHFIFIDFMCKTDSCEVILNEEAETYVWIELEDINEYNLDQFTRKLLKEIKNKGKTSEKIEIYYH